jgi:uncharacterized 2Fe-2S/4Fe-4S cluster protein (DUF4445 family)
MADLVRIMLKPLGHEFTVERGTPLQDVLFTYGVEFPCGGNAACEGCKLKVLSGNLAVTPEQENILSRKEIEEGWRLACCCSAEEDITLELEQWEARVLSDETRFKFTPRRGLGVAIDLGTTTLAAQLLDLSSGDVLAVETALNEQGRFGADVMSRIFYAVSEHGQKVLEQAIRTQLKGLVTSLVASAGADPSLVLDVVIVGNTVMHHLFSGIDVTPLSQYPFESPNYGLQRFQPEDLGWSMIPHATARFLPCLGSFVGSDILAGILATGVHRSKVLVGLIDLGTNGEIVLGNRERLLFCSTAAGPAFEGSCIKMGMRATTGAIAQVTAENGGFKCRVLGHGLPRGICGSGLVDAVAVGLTTQHIREDGKILKGNGSVPLCPPVEITQSDIRELQVAKAAIAAGVQILLNDLGRSVEDVNKLYLAGAFGNYIDRTNAHRIGLLRIPLERIEPAGNSALLGAKLALFNGDERVFSEIKQIARHVSLNTDEQFQDIFVGEMSFPLAEEV